MNLLFVSFHFPPSRTARSLQLGKLTKYLARRGHTIDVVTVETGALGVEYDEKVAQWIATPSIRAFRVPSPPRSLRCKIAAALQGQNFPGWKRAATRELLRLARAGDAARYDALVSFAMPIDSHYAARTFKRQFHGLPWIAHFADPWASDPYAEVGAWWRQKLFNAAQHSFIREADRIVGVSEELTDYIALPYPSLRHKFRTLHHVYDPEQYPDEAPPPTGPTVLKYLGGFSPRRQPTPLVDALKLARDRGAPLASLRIELIGSQIMDAADRLNAVHAGIAVNRGPVGYWESLREMRTAHALLLIDADQEVSPYFPSKLADYFGGGRPIVAITPAHSCSARLLREYGGACFEARQTEQIAELLARVARDGPAALPNPNHENVVRFEADRLAAQFEELVAEVTLRRRAV